MLPAIQLDAPLLPLEGQHADGYPSDTELRILCGLVQERQPNAIFEFGTFRGRTALHLARYAPEATVFTLDLPAGEKGLLPYDQDEHYTLAPKGLAFHGKPEAARIVQLFGDSASFDYFPFCRSVDFVWIDACHSFEACLNDSLKALMLLRQGGMIAWHDYQPKFWPGVVAALESLREHSKAFANLKHVQGTSLAVLQ